MDPQTQASFIPKKPLVSGAGRSRATFSITWLVVILLFIGSLGSAGAAFGYQQYLQTTLASQKNSLQLEQAAYDPSVITEILRLDQRMQQAHTLLSSHLAPLALFTYLEQRTLTNVRFTDFSYQYASGGSVTLALSGEALDFSSVALQSDSFDASSTPLKDVLFSNVNLNPATGHVTFQVTATVDPGLISYEKNLSTTPAATTTTSAASSTASSPQ